jgi:hypothetical protein
MSDLIELTKEIAFDKKYNIITRAGDENSLAFKTIDAAALEKISERMPELYRANNSFGRQNSQHTSMLMSLAMIDSTPYRRLRQILAQVEKKRMALKENIFKLQKDKVKIEMLLAKTFAVDEVYEQRLNEIEIAELQSGQIDGQVYLEGCLKEIGQYQDAYFEICKNKNIPENWDELDFEEAEVEHHIRMIFTNAIRDLMSGSRANVGSCEYAEQYGLHPVVVYELASRYLQSVNQAISQDKAPTIEVHYKFLDEMVEMFKDEWKKAIKHSGLDSATHGSWLYRTDKGLRE